MFAFFSATAAEPLGPPAPSLATLDVAAANIWGIPDFVHPRFKNLERLQGAAGDWLARARERHDVVAIQEAWNGMWRQDLANLRILLDLGVVMGRDPAAKDDRKRDAGLAFLPTNRDWTFTFVRQDPFDVRATGFDGLTRKGFAVATLTSKSHPGLEVVIVNTHLQASGATKHALIRQAQVDETLRWLATEDRPIIWMGDFNFYRDADAARTDDETIRRMQAAGFTEGAEVFTAAQHWATNIDGQRYDRVWIRGSLPGADGAHALSFATYERHVNGGDDTDRDTVRALSDHIPLEARIVVRER